MGHRGRQRWEGLWKKPGAHHFCLQLFQFWLRVSPSLTLLSALETDTRQSRHSLGFPFPVQLEGMNAGHSSVLTPHHHSDLDRLKYLPKGPGRRSQRLGPVAQASVQFVPVLRIVVLTV